MAFLLDLMVYVADHSTYRPKVVLSNVSATVHRTGNKLESDWIDSILLRFTDYETNAPHRSVPVVIDTSDARYTHTILDEMLLPYCETDGKFEFLQVFFLWLSFFRFFAQCFFFFFVAFVCFRFLLNFFFLVTFVFFADYNSFF